MRYFKLKMSACAAILAAPCVAAADEAAVQMVQDALPVMHYTCASIAEEADGDEAATSTTLRA